MHRQPVASPNTSEPTKVELVRTRWVLKRASGCWTINTGVPADEGFWVGRPGSRVWVRLVTDKESGRRIRARETLSFTGQVVANKNGFVVHVYEGRCTRTGGSRAPGGTCCRPAELHHQSLAEPVSCQSP